MCQLTVCDMQTANVSYGIKSTAVTLDDDDDDEGGGEGEALRENEELTKMMEVPDRVEAVIMEVQQDVADTGASTVSGQCYRLPGRQTKKIGAQ